MKDVNVSDFQRAAVQLDKVPLPTLELLDKQVTAFVRAIWRARGIRKKIITMRPGDRSEQE